MCWWSGHLCSCHIWQSVIFATMKKLPIGKQDFPSLIGDGYLYIDKTEHIHRLMNAGPYIFLSRPRRFGKSLLVSTLKEIFEGNKKPFKGLWIEDKIAWEPYPVIRVDFNEMDYRGQPLEEALSRQINDIAERHDLAIPADWTSKEKFAFLLNSLGGNGKKAVVLIDEYDKAITDFLGEDEARIRENVLTLKNFYSTLKSLDRCIHFVFITGVSRYGRVSIFSDLNNLFDISMDKAFASLLGWTEEEVLANFPPRLLLVAAEVGLPMPKLLEEVRKYYNGYSWDGNITLYNPFSLLSFLQSKRFANYWFTTGTPSFLTNLLKKRQITAYELESVSGSEALLESADVNAIDPVSLLFQTGYLTIKKIDATNPVRNKYFLSYPNEEVRDSFLKYLLADYVDKPVFLTESTYTTKMRDALEAGDLDGLFRVLSSLFASIPYQITGTHESYFHTVVHVALTLTGFVIHSEIPTNQGRMNAVLDTGKHIYLFEFKLRDSADAALAQIRAKGYPERFQTTGRTLTLVGVAFDVEAKNVREWKQEEYPPR